MTATSDLTKLLCAEMSAVETYNQAIESFHHEDDIQQLEIARDCHVKRVDTLAGTLYALGGSPTESSGIWGKTSRALDAGGEVVTDKMAVALLEEGEERGIQQYRELVETTKADPAIQTLATQLLTQQEETQRIVKALQEKIG